MGSIGLCWAHHAGRTQRFRPPSLPQPRIEHAGADPSSVATLDRMRVTVLSGGIGGARFLSGLLDALALGPGGAATTDSSTPHPVTVIGNTADDIWMFGLKICPDLDTVMYTLG